MSMTWFDVMATMVYPGLTALCVFWASVAIARWVASRRVSDILLALTMIWAASTFAILSLSTGLLAFLPFDEMRLAMRLGFAATWLAGVAFSVVYIRRQHAIYRQHTTKTR
jgi:hypothetical protein